MSDPVKTLLFSTLYPSSARPLHGVFVETRLRELLGTGQVSTKVVAPVPWYPSWAKGHSRYRAMAATPKREAHNGVDVLHPSYLVVPKISMNITPLTLALAARPALAQLLREGFDFDLIDAHYYYPDGVAAALLARWFNKPLAITARGTDVNLIPEFRVPRMFVRWAARQATASIGVSAALVERMRGLGMPAERLMVLRNGVDMQRFQRLDRSAARQAVAAKLGLATLTGPVLLAVGNLYEFKGQRLVVQALAQVHQQHPGATLLVVGQGEDRDAIISAVAAAGVTQAVHLAGPVPNAELATWYSAADVTLLASAREGWPNVLLESMACGTPVVATRVGGVPEIVQNDVVGRMADRSAAALAAAVNELLAQASGRSDAGADVRAYAQGFGWDRTSQDQVRLFNAMAGRTAVASA